jgi:hypothetical protein
LGRGVKSLEVSLQRERSTLDHCVSLGQVILNSGSIINALLEAGEIDRLTITLCLTYDKL